MQEINYIDAILNCDRKTLTRMYVQLSPLIRKMIRNHGGTDADAQDVFHDAVIVVYEKARQPDFELTSKFSTYFYGICRYIWLSRQQKKSATEVTIPEEAKYIPDESYEIDLLRIERSKLLYRSLRELDEDCQAILELFFRKQSFKDIAREMGFSSETYARIRKARCKDKLVEIIRKAAEFDDLTSL